MMSEAGAAPVDPAPPAPAPAPAPAHALLDTSWPVRAWVGGVGAAEDRVRQTDSKAATPGPRAALAAAH